MPRRHRRSELPSKGTKSKRILYIIGFLVVLVIIFTSVVNGLKKTLFFSHKDRVNLVFYGKQTTYFSLGINTEGDYAISFPADLKMPIPGGYGQYRVGALGKLVSLEKKPELFRNTFSFATFSFINDYFYTPSDDVYYGSDETIKLPSPKQIWEARSNAGLLDKLYLIFFFINKNMQDIHQITADSSTNSQGDDMFLADDFQKRITGYLFQQSYRNEQKSVQILYANNYINADRVGKMIEGNGIRVGDISQDGSLVKGCIVKEDFNSPSRSGQALVQFFHCQWQRGKSDFYDILFQLGEEEKEWEVK